MNKCKSAALPVKRIFTDKYLIMSIAAVVMAAASVLAGADSLNTLINTAVTAVILMGMYIGRSLRLAGKGVALMNRKNADKALSPRITGSMGDVSGIGSTMGALAGISVLLGQVFITDGGVFVADDFALPLLSSAAGALSTGVAVCAAASRESSTQTLYLMAAHSLSSDASGEDICRRAAMVGHYPDITRRLGGALCVRLSFAIGMAVVTAMTALSGAGAALSCSWIAVLTLLLTVITDIANMPGQSQQRTDESTALLTKRHKSFCAFNTAMFSIIAFFFLFSFPFRSVFSSYEVSHDFYYSVELTGKVDIISLPVHNDDNASLFPGFFIVTAIYLLICGLWFCLDKEDIKNGRLITGKGSVIATAGTVIIAVGMVTVNGILFPQAALEPVMWLVCVSVGCLMALADMIWIFCRREK